MYDILEDYYFQLFLDAICSWNAHLSSPAAFPGLTSSQGVSQVTRLRAIEPADIPIWLKHLDQSRTKTAEELDVLLGEDRELFIEVSVSFACVFVPHNTADRTAK